MPEKRLPSSNHLKSHTQRRQPSCLARSFLDPALPKGDRKKKTEGYGEPALGALLGLEDPVNHVIGASKRRGRGSRWSQVETLAMAWCNFQILSRNHRKAQEIIRNIIDISGEMRDQRPNSRTCLTATGRPTGASQRMENNLKRHRLTWRIILKLRL